MSYFVFASLILLVTVTGSSVSAYNPDHPRVSHPSDMSSPDIHQVLSRAAGGIDIDSQDLSDLLDGRDLHYLRFGKRGNEKTEPLADFLTRPGKRQQSDGSINGFLVRPSRRAEEAAMTRVVRNLMQTFLSRPTKKDMSDFLTRPGKRDVSGKT